jgi:hypothetical protein
MLWNLAQPSQPAMVDETYLGYTVANADVWSSGRHWQVQVNLDSLQNSGVNVSGVNRKGDASSAWQALVSLALDVGCYVLPEFAFECLVASQMLNLYGYLSGINNNPPTDFFGDGSSFVKYGVIGGGSRVVTPSAYWGEAKDVFGGVMLLNIQIPYDPVAKQFPFAPTFSFGATNWIHDPNWYYDGYKPLVIGANASVTLNSYPAVLISGTVCRDAQDWTGNCQHSQPQANQPIVLTTWNANQQIFYHLTTDTQGMFSFFAPLNSGPYQLYTTYSSPFGTITTGTPWFSTHSEPDLQTVNLQLPTIYGQVVSAGSNPHPIVGATMIITSPGGTQYSTLTDGAGNYVVTVGVQGTYSVKAMAYGYQYATASPTVNANNGFLTNFGLISATPDFTPTSCGTASGYTNSAGSCAITIASNAGWYGNVVVTTSQPSGSGAPTISSVSSPVWVSQFGTGTSYVYFAMHDATGSWVVTVTLTSQDGTITRQTTFTISVGNPPGGGGGICTPSHCPT